MVLRRPYQIKHQQSHRLESVGERNGQEPTGCDGRPEDTGKVTRHLVRQRQGGLGPVGVHKASVGALQDEGVFTH